MRLKMYTPNGHEIIDSSEVAQFYPDAASGNQLTKIETLSTTGERKSVLVKHSFHQVTCALATAWRIDEQKAEQQLTGAIQ
ncbi:hypothetical protein ACS6JF_22070 [Enterobacter hormaechei subsp. hoffmannii]|uniref:hypothetical protein n=1 Tax=Enterobacter hormaechei TaxID=158836 RepID=UPI000F9C232D|nr:hypothetical protein [Salmonella enterica subsp. enterica]HEI8778706.1 hypothetical protein [Enterobacter cloacae]